VERLIATYETGYAAYDRKTFPCNSL